MYSILSDVFSSLIFDIKPDIENVHALTYLTVNSLWSICLLVWIAENSE